MEITKIGNFTGEEIAALAEAGKILGALAKALEAGEVNIVGEESAGLIKALKDVLGRVEK